MKKCAHCKELKALTEFGNDNSQVDGHKRYCRPCANAASVASRKKLVVSPLTGELVPRGTRINQVSRSTTDGREAARAAARANKKKRYMSGAFAMSLAANPVKQLRENAANLIRNSFKARKWGKHSKTQALLGCSFEELHQHLGPKPSEDAHIDHRIPCSCAKTERELIALQHWSNLQWLPARENLAKGSIPPNGWALELRLLMTLAY